MAIPRDQPVAPIGALTEREGAVLSLMAQGLTNAEIAASLHVAIGTVKAHVSSIFMKLGVRNRTEAVLIALGIPQP